MPAVAQGLVVLAAVWTVAALWIEEIRAWNRLLHLTGHVRTRLKWGWDTANYIGRRVKHSLVPLPELPTPPVLLYQPPHDTEPELDLSALGRLPIEEFLLAEGVGG